MKLRLDSCAESELVHTTVETFCWVAAIPLWTLQIVFPFYKGFGKPTFLSHYYGLCMVVLTLLSKSHYLPPFLHWSHMSLWTDKKICSPVCRWGHEEIKPQSLLITLNLSSDNSVLVICWVGLFIQIFRYCWTSCPARLLVKTARSVPRNMERREQGPVHKRDTDQLKCRRGITLAEGRWYQLNTWNTTYISANRPVMSRQLKQTTSLPAFDFIHLTSY